MRVRVALTEDVIEHGACDGVRHHHVDIVVTPLSIDVQIRGSNSLEGVAKAHGQAVAWDILRPYRDLDSMQLESLQQVVCNQRSCRCHDSLIRGRFINPITKVAAA